MDHRKYCIRDIMGFEDDVRLTMDTFCTNSFLDHTRISICRELV